MIGSIGRVAPSLIAALLLASCGGGGGSAGDPLTPPPEPGPVIGPAWPTFGRTAQHDARSTVQAQPLARKAWQAALDLAPQYAGSGSLLIHYGSPVVTERNTVILPVKTSASGGYKIEARRGSDGLKVWSAASGYRLPLPAPSWTPSVNPALTSQGKLVYPTAGGRLVWRDDPDRASSAVRTVAFYGTACDAAPATCDDTVFVNTPLTPDGAGGVWFGFTVSGANAAGLVGGGIAHVAADGSGRHVLATVAAADGGTTKPATNSAPALSADGATLYAVVNAPLAAGQRARGRLVALNTADLTPRAAVPLLDPANGANAWVSDNGTASPTVGPDGDVYIGVLESAGAPHNFRGWLLHFDPALAQSKLPAAFGWDITPSIVPAGMMPNYAGASSYLLAIKYNNYGGAGGDGQNRIAIVDPNQSQPDPVTPALPVMREVITAVGLTADPQWPPLGVKEWCINTMAVDPASQSVLVNSEDGFMYRWHLPTNSFTQQLRLHNGLGQAYTPTAVGPDGRVYAVSNAVLYSIGQ
jgi:hypothetical protein